MYLPITVKRKFNSIIPNDKILAWPKLKAYTDDKIYVAKMTISVLVRVENIVGKGENAGYRHFPTPTMFAKTLF